MTSPRLSLPSELKPSPTSRYQAQHRGVYLVTYPKSIMQELTNLSPLLDEFCLADLRLDFSTWPSACKGGESIHISIYRPSRRFSCFFVAYDCLKGWTKPSLIDKKYSIVSFLLLNGTSPNIAPLQDLCTYRPGWDPCVNDNSSIPPL